MDDKQLIPGFQATREALQSGTIKISQIWLKEGRKDDRIEEIQRFAKIRGIPVLYKKGIQLDQLLPDVSHQGVIAFAQSFHYVDLDRIIQTSLMDSGHALIVAADHITDEGNLGSLIRTGKIIAGF